MRQEFKTFKDRNIQGKLGLILSLFALLAIVNYVSVTYFKSQQKEDAPVVDAAGRNRMLSQRIGFFAERIVKGQEEIRGDLAKAVTLHNTSLNALKLGGVAPGIADDKVLPPTAPHIMPTLLEAEELWQKYKQQAEIILEAPLRIDTVQMVEVMDTTGHVVQQSQQAQILNPQVVEALKFIEKNAATMLFKNNELVKSYVRDNESKQSSVNNILLFLLLLNFALIGLALYTIRKFIIQPSRSIQQITHRLALGDLSAKSDYESEDEVGTAVRNINTMTRNLEGVAAFALAIGQGNFSSDFQAASEDDTIGKALVQMRDQLHIVAQEDKKRNWVSEGLTHFGNLLREDREDLEALAQRVLSSLIKYIEANQGALFVLNDENEEDAYLELVATYAWGKKKYIQKQVKPGEDLLGQAYLEQEIVYLKEIPEDYVEITSGIGKTTPRCLMIVPLKVNDEVFGMLELASLKEYDEYEQEFIRKVAENIASVFSAIKINQRTRYLLENTQQQAEEMRATEEEMRQNMEEISATQEEMTRKEKEYQRIIAELKADQKEVE